MSKSALACELARPDGRVFVDRASWSSMHFNISSAFVCSLFGRRWPTCINRRAVSFNSAPFIHFIHTQNGVCRDSIATAVNDKIAVHASHRRPRPKRSIDRSRSIVAYENSSKTICVAEA